MSLIHDIAASEPADVAQVILQLRHALKAVLDVIENELAPGASTPAIREAEQVIFDLDAGELLWPGWRPKEKAAS